jgi:hypothetical protein
MRCQVLRNPERGNKSYRVAAYLNNAPADAVIRAAELGRCRRTLRTGNNALRISSAGRSALPASQPADSADSAYGKLRLPPASLLIRSVLGNILLGSLRR